MAVYSQGRHDSSAMITRTERDILLYSRVKTFQPIVGAEAVFKQKPGYYQEIPVMVCLSTSQTTSTIANNVSPFHTVFSC